MGPGAAIIVTLIGIVGGGWVLAILIFRDVWGYFPWQGDAVREKDLLQKLQKEVKTATTCSGFEDPEDRCPRRPSDCVCWKPEVRDAIRARGET